VCGFGDFRFVCVVDVHDETAADAIGRGKVEMVVWEFGDVRSA
jgi:hypothetical protein